MSFYNATITNNAEQQFLYFFFASTLLCVKGGPGASGRVLPPVTGRSRVRVAVSSHCIGEGKACHWHPSPDPAQSGSSLHWVRLFSTLLCVKLTACSICNAKRITKLTNENLMQCIIENHWWSISRLTLQQHKPHRRNSTAWKGTGRPAVY